MILALGHHSATLKFTRGYSMTYTSIITDIADGIMTLTLNRPERLNAFTNDMRMEMMAALDVADADDSVRGIIVTGAGRAYCAGADLSSGGSTFNADARTDRPGGMHPDGGGLLTLRIYECKKPIVAAINGPAVGIGITMTLPMDVRIAADDARCGFVFSRRGIVPEACSSYFLPRVVGISQALQWCYSGRIFSAEEALAGGLVQSLHPADELLAAARAIIREIADNASPLSVTMIRHMMWRMLGADHPMEAHKLDSRGLPSRARPRFQRGGRVLSGETAAAVSRQGQCADAGVLSLVGTERILLTGTRLPGGSESGARHHLQAVLRYPVLRAGDGLEAPGPGIVDTLNCGGRRS